MNTTAPGYAGCAGYCAKHRTAWGQGHACLKCLDERTPKQDPQPLLVLELIDQGLSETLAQACAAAILERFTVQVRS